MQDWNSRYCSILKTNWKEAICKYRLRWVTNTKKGKLHWKKTTSYWKGIYLIRNTRDSVTLIIFHQYSEQTFCFQTYIYIFSNWDIGRWHLCSVETCFAHTIRLTLHDERVLRHFVHEDDENEKQYPHCPFHLDDRRSVTAIFVATEKLRELMY